MGMADSDSSIERNISDTFSPEERSIVHVLKRRIGDMPDKPWLVFEDQSVTFRQANKLSDQMAQGMAQAGLKRGDTLLVMLPDSLDLVLCWLACAKLG